MTLATYLAHQIHREEPVTVTVTMQNPLEKFSSETTEYLEHVPTTPGEKIAHFLHSTLCHVS